MRKWYESEECSSNVIIGGQICFVRNIDGYPFEDKMNQGERQALLESVCYAVRESEQALQMKFRFINLSGLKDFEQNGLVGTLAVPPQMIVKGYQAGLLISEDESVSILINGKEHLCIQVSCGDARIQEAVKIAGRVDDCLNQYLRYAYNNKYGYLTASPLLTGTGMSASYLLHLPYLEKKQHIPQLEKGLGQYGVSLRAHFHGQTQAPGSIYRLKNRKTLGLSESEILSALEHLARQLAAQEKRVAEQVLVSHRMEEEDRMYRAYGLLKYARNLGYDETMEYLSIIRSGYLHGIWQSGTGSIQDHTMHLFAMMLDAADAVLSVKANRNISSSERGYIRADYMRRHLPAIEEEIL